MPIDKDNFRKAMSRLTSGVTVVTSRSDEGAPRGITVSAFCSLSLDPPLVLVCIANNAAFHRVLREGQPFAVNILSESQEIVSRQFASRGIDRFEGIGYSVGATGTPLLDDVIAQVECIVQQCHSAGDHTIFVGQVEAARTAEGKPLAYFQGGYSRLA